MPFTVYKLWHRNNRNLEQLQSKDVNFKYF